MVQPDILTLRALNALKGQPEFQAFFDWLKRSYEDALQTLEDTREDENFRVAQGEARTLKQITSAIVGSREALDRAANTRP